MFAIALQMAAVITLAPCMCRAVETNYTDPLSAPLQSPPGKCTAAQSTPATVTLQANSSTVHW